MTLETDILLDRRRLKRRLFFWRLATVLVVVVCGLVLVSRGEGPGAYVARVTVNGLMGEETRLAKAVHDLAADGSVRAVIVSINSPGGAVAGGEALHDEIAFVAATKPVVVVMGGLAASAGYMIAVPASRIFARESTLTGSIGVLLETGEISGLLHMLGITDETLTSGPLKHEPSFTKPLSEQGRTVLQDLRMGASIPAGRR
jgi:protease-4